MRRVRTPDKRDGWYIITPAEAADLRSKFKRQRTMSRATVERYADGMRRGWVPNGETIVFDNDGNPLDGQHRFRASELADKSFEVYCVYGVDPSKATWDTINTSKPRSRADRLSIEGVTSSCLASAVLGACYSYEHSGTPIPHAKRARPTNGQCVTFWNSNRPRLEWAVGLARDLSKPAKGVIVPKLIGFIAAEALRFSTERAEVFCRGLATGEGLSKSNPVLVLRNRLIQEKLKGTRLSKEMEAALLIKGWNAFARKRALRTLKWQTDESFPVIWVGDK